MSYPNWDAALEEKDRCQAKAEQMKEEIARAEAKKTEAEKRESEIHARQEMLKNAFAKQEKDEAEYQCKFTGILNEKGFSGKEDQAAGFDEIIRAANRRLLLMSDGQYELSRQEDSPGKKSNTFLALDVFDNFTGHKRPVGSLSGGESFKASLSLALGLSDTVCSNLGGIQMDALFVDEGFGTLDRKSIENAMDILLNLSGNNKLVGIISHREELIDNIPQQIRIKKGKSGSQIIIDNGL